MLEVSEELKKAFMTDNVEKQIRITFPNGEHEDITNENIVANSMSFTESLCSEDTLKFGLCEANVFKVTAECENIKGCQIEVFIDAYYEGEVFTVPYGVFTVQSCKREAGTHLRDIEAYTESVTENSVWNEYEQWKRSVPSLLNEPYVLSINRAFVAQTQYKNNLVLSKTQKIYSTRKAIGLYPFDYKTIITIGYDVLHVNRETEAIYINRINNFFKIKINNKSKVDFFRDKLKEFGVTNAYGKPINKERWQNNPALLSQDIYSLFDSLTDLAKPILGIIYFKAENETTYSSYYDWNTNVDYERIYDLYYSGFKPYSRGAIGNYNDIYLYIPTNIIIYNANGIQRQEFDVNPEVTVEFYEENTNSDIFNLPIERDAEITIPYLGATGYYVSSYDKQIQINDIFNSYLEIQGLFGMSSKCGGYDVITINNNFARYPEDELFPDDEIFPVIGENYQPLSTTAYKAADYEEYKTHKYGYVRVTYLATDNEKYSITVECDPRYDNVYEMNDNFIFLNQIWTADKVKEAIKTYFYPNIKDIEYNPANVSIKGLPFIEAGDLIKVYADEGAFKTFVLRRTLTGEQLLTDLIEASGEERNENSEAWIAVAGQEEKS